MAEMREDDYGLIDLYDLLTLEDQNVTITFNYAGTTYRLDIFQNEGETVFQFGDKWYHGAEDFLEKARIDRKRITTVVDRITNIQFSLGKQ